MFDVVAALSVEGVNKSAIARICQIAWNTVARWREKAAASCRRFEHRRITTLAMHAGLAKRRLTFRGIFLSLPRFLRLIKVNCILIPQATSSAQEDLVMSLAG
jgi:hypothetical protein